jgi:hypothetical protein
LDDLVIANTADAVDIESAWAVIDVLRVCATLAMCGAIVVTRNFA